MTDSAHEARAHAVLGASSSHRWMACPGSVRLSEGLPNRSSKYADEGTAAHQLAEHCLTYGRAAADAVGGVQLVRGVEWPVTEEMAEAVQVFLDTVRAAIGPGDTLLIEQQFDLSRIYPGMFGTNDACVIAPATKTLHVFDYKHGRGHVVEAKGNPQLRYYALGALLHTGAPVQRVSMTIVQPRAHHPDGPVRTDAIDVADLLEWAGELRRAAKATAAPDAPVRAGEHCTFCRAAATCPALRDRALEAAMAQFGGATITVPASPQVLGVEDLAAVLRHADFIDGWVAAVRAHALHLAESGQAIPGFKLVAKRATRKWRDEAEVPQRLSTALDVDALYDRKLRSPAQIEKLLPKAQRDILAELTVKESSGVNLVPEDDARAAKTPSATFDFAHLFNHERNQT